ncbi:MAG TPA: sulfatase-like hydrolase/transferase, partial [Anaerolineales bacterium]|nr:sulfatase-like hydrolase/transferase [Anaerolineales bacterium]
YIILDGYGRSDVLDRLYGLDESAFLKDLEARGFYVADQSRSNYGQTSLSFASALNMSYLDDVAAAAGDDISQRQIARLIRFNEVSRVLRGLGYSVTAFSNGYRRVELSDADQFSFPSTSGITPFEALLLESNAIWGARSVLASAGLPLAYPGYDVYRQRIEAGVERLWQSPSLPGPKFVFAHLMIPHPPFVFDGDGGPLTPDAPFRGADGNQFMGSHREYIEGYRQQVLFAQHVLLVFLDHLAETGDDSAIVIVQGDHGPGSQLDWNHPERTDAWERTSILNAYRSPGIASSAWWPSITPVNTFRVLFDELFGGSYPKLPDRSYFSSWRAPYSFIPVPAQGGLGQ